MVTEARLEIFKYGVHLTYAAGRELQENDKTVEF